MLAIPGLGPVVAAGWLASTAAGAVIGAIAGGATGGLVGALKHAGESDEDAQVYAEGVRRGGTLVSVKVDENEVAAATLALDGANAVSASARGSAYREQGWSGFNEAASPFSPDDIRTERSRYTAR